MSLLGSVMARLGLGPSDLQKQVESLRLEVEKLRAEAARAESLAGELAETKERLRLETARRQELEVLLRKSEEARAADQAKTAELAEQVRTLKIQLADARSILAKNSRNSSKRPSSDFPKPNGSSADGDDAKPDPKSLRMKTGRKPGGQKGHKGSGFSLPRRDPDETVVLTPPECEGCPLDADCAKCQKQAEARYVLDFIVKQVLKKYIAVKRKCPLREGAWVCGVFPEGVEHTKQYGDMFNAVEAAMYVCFDVPFPKIHRFISILTGTRASVGRAWNQFKNMAERKSADAAIGLIRGWLLEERSVCADETGARCARRNYWIHTVSTRLLTLQHASRKRGVEGMKEMDFLTQYIYTLMTDAFPAYFSMDREENRRPLPAGNSSAEGDGSAEGRPGDALPAESGGAPPDAPRTEGSPPDVSRAEGAPSSGREDEGSPAGQPRPPMRHALCCAHLLRNLLWACEHGPGHEEGKPDWAKDVACWLLVCRLLRLDAKAKGQKSFSRDTVENFRDIFRECVDEGLRSNQETPETKGSRCARTVRALLRRMEKRVDEYTRFLEDFDVPFSQNEAERDLRDHKNRLAVSGCFRTEEGLKRYVKLFSIFKTGHKLGTSWLDIFLALINGTIEEALPYERVSGKTLGHAS